jgi:hypothetical protein
MTEPAADRCTELKAEIDNLQKEFEQIWLTISAGVGDPAKYRQLRHELQEKRIEYNRDCGTGLVEDSTLPRSVTSDWRGS